MTASPEIDTEGLLDLARQRSRESREELFGNITDLFLKADHRLTDRERSIMAGILARLVDETDRDLRKAIARQLAGQRGVPDDLARVLANDDVDVARPILMAAGVLSDTALVQIVRQRGREHAIAIANRETLSEVVSDALVDTGDEEVLLALIENPGAALSRAAQEYLVAEAARIDRFREPLLERSDLPADLAMRLYWFVSAALRRYIVERFDIESIVVDDAIEATSAPNARHDTGSPAIDKAAAELAALMRTEGKLSPGLVIHALRQGRVPLAVAVMAEMARLETDLVRHVLLEAGGESLAILARATEFDAKGFADLFRLSRARLADRTREAKVRGPVLEFFEGLTVLRARSVVSYWRRDPGYRAAIDTLNDALSTPDAPTEGDRGRGR